MKSETYKALHPISKMSKFLLSTHVNKEFYARLDAVADLHYSRNGAARPPMTEVLRALLVYAVEGWEAHYGRATPNPGGDQ
jgi:hypothetical protein